MLAVFGMNLLVACMTTPPTRSVFRTPGIGDAQWSRIADECLYEAEKATAAANPRTAVAYTRNRLFAMCAELKGASFVGRVTMADEQWERLSTRCKQEAADGVSGLPASRSRDERKEDLEFECFRRNGVHFRQSYYP